MARSPQEILNYLPLTTAVQTVKTGIPNVLPDVFWSTKEQILGDKASYIQYTGTRAVAKVTPYGSPPRQTRKLDISDKSVRLLHASEEMPFSQELYDIFRAWEDYKPQQARALQQIDHQATQFRQRFDNLRVAATTMVLGAAGLLYFDVDGNLLPTSSGADLTVDMGVQANNKNQLNGIIAASWATTSTDIISQIINLKVQAAKDTGYPLKYALYGKKIPGYFAANTTVQNFMARNSAMNDFFLKTMEIPNGFMDLQWIPVYTAFFEDSGGTNREIFDGDAVTFCPEINKSTWTFFEGSFPVPSQYGAIYPSADQALAAMKDVYGIGRYAYLPNPTAPVTIHDVSFDTFMPMIRVPNAFYFADVTP